MQKFILVENINLYREYIRDLANTRSDEVFKNSSPKHAAIVLSNIFAQAQTEVLIFAGTLNGLLSKETEYQDSFDLFLQKKHVHIKILVENDSNFNPNLKEKLKILKENGCNLEIKQHNYILLEENTKVPLHFTLADSSMYRIETNTKTHYADGCFNDTSDTSTLFRNSFFDIYNSSDAKIVNIN